MLAAGTIRRVRQKRWWRANLAEGALVAWKVPGGEAERGVSTSCFSTIRSAVHVVVRLDGTRQTTGSATTGFWTTLKVAGRVSRWTSIAAYLMAPHRLRGLQADAGHAAFFAPRRRPTCGARRSSPGEKGR